MNAQQLFNRVVKHLRKQNKPSLLIDGTCAYRGKDGKQCAIGCLIKDSEYDSSFEHNSIIRLLRMESIPASLRKRLEPHKDLLMNLQRIHDGDPVISWESDFAEVAKTYNLKLTPKKDK